MNWEMTRGARHAILILVALWIFGGSFSIWYSAHQSQRNVEAIHASQVRVCEDSLKPGGVRYIVAQQIRNQLTQSQNLDYHRFFPNIPSDELDALIVAQRREQQREIRDLLGVDCRAQYAKP